jgi:hypothetical protein
LWSTKTIDVMKAVRENSLNHGHNRRFEAVHTGHKLRFEIVREIASHGKWAFVVEHERVIGSHEKWVCVEKTMK